MQTKSIWRFAVVIATLVSASCSDSEPPTACNRACLIELAEGYLEAIAAHDSDSIALSDEVTFVENITRMNTAEGLWESAVGTATDFRIYVPDPVQSTVGIMTVIDRQTETGTVPAQLAVRLLIENREIIEIEHLIADVTTQPELARLEAPRPNIIAAVPEDETMLHDDLVNVGESYYEGLNLSDSSLVPFAADCERQENGMITAGPELGPATFDSIDVNGRSPPPVARDCIGQMDSRRFAYIDSIDNRRVFAIDPVQGLAMGLSHFRQSMSRGAHLMIAADGSELMWEEQREPYDLPAVHIFKITSGEIHEVEAIGIFVPYGSPTGWE